MLKIGLCFSVCPVLVNEDEGVKFFCVACMDEDVDTIVIQCSFVLVDEEDSGAVFFSLACVGL